MRRSLLLCAIIACALPRPLRAERSAAWVVSAARARALLAEGATLVDVRVLPPFTPRIAGALVVDWRASTRRGALLPAAELVQRLRALGLSAGRPLLVFGAPLQQWGEDGRVVWMLRSLGHARAALVDGGVDALRLAGVVAAQRPPIPGELFARPQPQWTIERRELRRLLRAPADDVVLVDAREPREHGGATPYGEPRGGHLPGSVHLHYRALLDGQGRLLRPARLRRLLEERGILPGKQVVTYCTAGVRSAWLAVVLLHLGYPRVRSYAAGLRERAPRPADELPLVR